MNLQGTVKTRTKDENGVLLTNCHILNMWKNYFQLMNVHGISDIWQIEMHTAEPLIYGQSPFGVEIAIGS
jgi:hypothetical protein